MKIINNIIEQFIKHEAAQTYPSECCGLLVKKGENIEPISCKNISKTPEKSFIIDNAEILKYGFDNIIGFYHSHKNELNFSLADIAFSEKTKKNCILYCYDFDTFKEYEPKGMEIPYENRPFFVGVLDCFTLYVDYYRRELNIKIPPIEHKERYNVDNWKTEEFYNKYKDKNILENYLLSNGFVKVSDLKKHDIILTKIFEIPLPIHLMIYLGDNKVLHHLQEFSIVEGYNKALKRFSTGIYRHNTLI